MVSTALYIQADQLTNIEHSGYKEKDVIMEVVYNIEEDTFIITEKEVVLDSDNKSLKVTGMSHF